MKTAEYFAGAVAVSGKSQIDIAQEAGFPKANIITMMKKGQTRIPLARVPALATALSIDAQEFMSKCLQEYQPELFRALQQTYGIGLRQAAESREQA